MLALKIILSAIAAVIAFLTFMSTSLGLYMNLLRDPLHESIGPRTRAKLTAYWSSLNRSSGSLFIDEVSRVLRWAERFKSRQQDWTLSLIAISVLVTRLAMFPESIAAVLDNSHSSDDIVPDVWVPSALTIRYTAIAMLIMAVLSRTRIRKGLWLTGAAVMHLSQGILAYAFHEYLTNRISFPVLLLSNLRFVIIGAVLLGFRKSLFTRMRSAWGWTLFFLVAALLLEALLWANRLLTASSNEPLTESLARQWIHYAAYFGIDLQVILLYALNFVFDRLTVRDTVAYMRNQLGSNRFTWPPLFELFGNLLRYAVLVFLAGAALDYLLTTSVKPLYPGISDRLSNPARFPGFYLYALSSLLPITLLFLYLALRAFSGYLARRASSLSRRMVRSFKDGTDPVYLSYMSFMMALSVCGSFVSWSVAFNALTNLFDRIGG